MKTIRQQLEPMIRAAGIAPTARTSGVSRISIQNWFAGKQNMSDEQIEAIVKALGARIVIRKGQ